MDANEFLAVCVEGNQALESKEYFEIKTFLTRMLRKSARFLTFLFGFIAITALGVHVAAVYSNFTLAQHISFWILSLSAPMIPGLYILLKVTSKVITPSFTAQTYNPTELLNEARQIITALESENQQLRALPVGTQDDNKEYVEILEMKLTRSNAEIARTKSELYKAQYEIEAMESSLKKQIAYLEGMHHSLEEHCNVLKCELDAYRKQLDATQDEREKYRAKNEMLECEIHHYRDLADKTKHELMYAHKAMENLEKALLQKNQDYDNLKLLAPAETTGQMQ